MNRNDIDGQPRFAPRDMVVALGLLTRLPLPARVFEGLSDRAPARAAWAYPLVGLVTGGIAVLTAWAAGVLGLGPSVQAIFALLAGALVTGAMHEDGLADCVDGFWGGWTRERRLEIMKDSQIGTYGVFALVLSLLLRWQAVTLLIASGGLLTLIPVAILSRAAMVWVMAQLGHARAGGLSAATGRPPRPALLAALGIGAAAAILSGAFLATLVVAVAMTLAVASIARRKIGGQTGDVLGATQQLVEVTCLLTLIATLP